MTVQITKPANSVGHGSLVTDDRDRGWNWAHENVTPLQQRVLDQLTPEVKGLTEIAEGTRLIQFVGGNSARPDKVTTRNVLGWLTNKGLAVMEAEGWRLPDSAPPSQAPRGKNRGAA